MDRITLGNSAIEVECYPAHGFAIGAIRRRDSLVNLLWNPEGARFDPLTTELGPSGTASIDTFDRGILAGGWFLMFPTAGLPGVDAEGVGAPQWMHGETARLPWKVLNQSGTSVQCEVRTRHFLVQREVRLLGNEVRVSTEATNVSSSSQSVTFGEHPCFPRPVFGGGTVQLSAVEAAVTSIADPPNSRLAEREVFTWPQAPLGAGGLRDLSVIPEQADGRHDHVWLKNVEGRASIVALSGELNVQLSWDAKALPYALLWQHFLPLNSPWGGDVFALEPVSAPGRTSDDAVNAGAHTSVSPMATVSSWAVLRVDGITKLGTGPTTSKGA